jgi:hypothetical protein
MSVKSFTKQVKGSMGNFYEVKVTTDSSIKVTCECKGAINGSLCKHLKAELRELISTACEDPIKESLLELGLNEYLEELDQAQRRCEEAKKVLSISKRNIAKTLGLRK